AFRSSLRGELCLPGEAGFEEGQPQFQLEMTKRSFPETDGPLAGPAGSSSTSSTLCWSSSLVATVLRARFTPTPCQPYWIFQSALSVGGVISTTTASRKR